MAVGIGLTGLAYINTGTTGSPTWTEIGGQKSASISFKKKTVDITCKGNAGWEDFIGTTRGWSLTIKGLVDEVDAGYLYMEAMFFDNATREFKLVTPVGRTYIGTAEMDSLDDDFPYDSTYDYSVSLKGKGALAAA